MRTWIASSLAVVGLLAAPVARAEPASWASLGLGWSGLHNTQFSKTDTALMLGAQLGLGSSLASPWVIGAVAGFRESFALGPDVTLSARVVNRGFMLGEWGAGVDLGVTWRTYQQSAYGHFPFEPALLVGFPWGPVLAVGADLGDVTGQSPGSTGFFAMMSMDIVRIVAARAHTPASFFPDPPPPTERTIERVN